MDCLAYLNLTITLAQCCDTYVNEISPWPLRIGTEQNIQLYVCIDKGQLPGL